MKAELERVYETDYPAEPRIVHEVREMVERFVSPAMPDEDDLEAVKVAVSEAFSNAVCHGSPRGSENRVHVRCSISGQNLSIEVTDEGGGFLPTQIVLPEFDEWKPSGRGLFLIQALMDEVEFQPQERGTRVRLSKQLPRQPAETYSHSSKERRVPSGGGLSFATAALSTEA